MCCLFCCLFVVFTFVGEGERARGEKTSVVKTETGRTAGKRKSRGWEEEVVRVLYGREREDGDGKGIEENGKR